MMCMYNTQYKTSTFKELLKKDNSVLIHYRNIQALAIEVTLMLLFWLKSLLFVLQVSLVISSVTRNNNCTLLYLQVSSNAYLVTICQ